jgi:transcriptional regulator with XRE-family HTH domain
MKRYTIFDMITLENIAKKREKYSLSQEQLAKQIGISRPTLDKIEKGKRTLKESEKIDLIKVFEDLETEGNPVRINIPEKNIQKFEQVLLYILERVGARPNVGKTVIYKLLYFIDFDYYEKFEKQLLGLTYFKNHYGPAPREFSTVIEKLIQENKIIPVSSSFFSRDQKKFLPRISPDLSVLNGQELDMINEVLDKYADRSATELSEMTHRDVPWQVADFGADIDYEYAFYRRDEFSVREYEEL